ncbi:type II CAAX prenyl endopeptidase Rce1 family protein [Marinimicrobium sp. ABcell2]|uniref:CPBP family glutamic-type intramembrane protease n=1 Tax=Marinimicrobium sp. ABcell2 TaxID=3069751 RepID=UPI0027AE45EC|nr:CPBP family glutamic-type intramembrane protease [Marinimicrobium sp. ABcell2]MDQ2077128.1 CPBP family glutamic-type intramembrane protease [Marinimicrobium sp. ABcell2]
MKLGKRTQLIGLLVGISLPGIVLIALQVPGMVEHLDAELPPRAVLILSAAIQSLVLVSVVAALGAWVAPKVNLRAPAIEGLVDGNSPRSILASQAKFALPVGFGVGVLIVAVEAVVFQPYLPDTLYLLGTPMTLNYLLAALTYGGIVEEVLLRWGVMSLVAWLIFLVLGRRHLGIALVLGNILAAILFGIGHLPAVGLMVGELTTPIILRTLILNAVPGFIFGMFFQRRGLEAAMFAHMGVHVGMAVPRVIFGA